MKLKNITGRDRFIGSRKSQIDKTQRLIEEDRRKAQADRDGTLLKYNKTNNPPIESITPIDLTTALDAVVQDIKSMSKEDLHKALLESANSQFAQTIDQAIKDINTH